MIVNLLLLLMALSALSTTTIRCKAFHHIAIIPSRKSKPSCANLNFKQNGIDNRNPFNKCSSSVQRSLSITSTKLQIQTDQNGDVAEDNQIIPRPLEQSEEEVKKLESSTAPATEAILLLNLVAVIWGTQHSIIKMVVEDCDASAFSLARFGLATLLASPFTPPLRPVWDRIVKRSELGVSSENSKLEDNVFVTKENSQIKVGHEINGSENTNSVLTTKDSEYNSDDAIQAWRWGIEMGFWMFLGYAFQAIGLGFTSAQRSGFLLYLNVKFVPFLAKFIFGREISLSTWISAFVAFSGTGLLALYGDVSTSMTNNQLCGLNIGDAWSIAAALASAMFILRLETASKRVPNSAALNSASLWVVTFTSLCWCLGEGFFASSTFPTVATDAMTVTATTVEQGLSPLVLLESIPQNFNAALGSTLHRVIDTIIAHPLNLLYLGGVTTALANYIQTKAQSGVSAERASIIYALDPVYGAFFANVILGEELSSLGIVGAGLITIAAATNAFLDLSSNNSSTSNGEGDT